VPLNSGAQADTRLQEARCAESSPFPSTSDPPGAMGGRPLRNKYASLLPGTATPAQYIPARRHRKLHRLLRRPRFRCRAGLAFRRAGGNFADGLMPRTAGGWAEIR
jgi:hypothetical protein